jgi:hypothetical protein
LQSPPGLKEYVQTVLNGADKVLIVLDNMDESDEAEHKAMLAFLLLAVDATSNSKPGAVRALFSYQGVADMRSTLRIAAVVMLNARNSVQDIRSVPVNWAAKIWTTFGLPADEVQRIIDYVTVTVSGESLDPCQ